MTFKFIRHYEDISQYVDGPFNDPEEELNFDEDTFDEEYEKVRDALVRVVEEFCGEVAIPSDDVSVGHRTGSSRGIGLVVEERSSSYLVFLFEKIRDYLRGLAVDYCVSINLVLDEHCEFKDLYFAVTKANEVLLHADKKEWFNEIKGLGVAI
ncbi:MAG: hypothetical protein L3J39_12575 [Verrucomicrobiales bacterium]|nr:hypothetical protein [Verrucomicrobiales bacterium]